MAELYSGGAYMRCLDHRVDQVPCTDQLLSSGSCRGGTAVRSHPQLLNGGLRSTTASCDIIALSMRAPTEVLLAVIGTPGVTQLSRIWHKSFAVPQKPRHRRLSSPASGNLQDPRREASAHYTAEQGMLHRLHRCSAFDSDADKECLRLGTLFKSPWAMLLFKRRKQRPTGR